MTRATDALNPLTPLAAAVLLVVASYAGPQPAAPVAACVTALAAAVASGVGRRVVILVLVIAVPTFALLFLMNAVVAPPDVRPFAERLTLSYEPTREAARVALRLAAAVAALGWLIAGVPARRLTRALSERGLPSWAAYILVASLDAVPLARRRAAEVIDAQRCRGLRVHGSPATRVRALAPMAAPLIVSLVAETEERALALEARGFVPGRRRTSLDPIPDPRAERTARLAIWLGIVALLVWRFAVSFGA